MLLRVVPVLLRLADELLRLEEARLEEALEREELALLRLADEPLRLEDDRVEVATLRPVRPAEEARLMLDRLTDEREAPPPRLTLLERVAPPKADALVLFLATLCRPLFSGPYRWRFT